ncbi:MAG: serine hydrolase [Gemmatimonadetes bacterium]|nr:serine hydrolase [Gemmatimonadota bacterium]
MTDLELNLPLTHQLLLEGIDAGLHPGAQIYVSQRGAVVANDGIGESRPGVPMTCDTLNLWMSCTKPITAVLLGQLWEQGQMDIDAPAAEVIPEFAQAGKSDITFRHILTHTGGFRTEPADLYELDWDDAVASVCELELEPDWLPGERAGYHPSTSWYVLGKALCRIYGEPFPEVVRSRLFDPVGMRDSWIGIPPDRQNEYGERIGWMHLTRRALEPHDASNSQSGTAQVRPSGNGRGPIRELGRFYEMLLAGGEGFLTERTITALTSRQRVGLFDQTFQHEMDWGLGFMVDNNRYGPDTVPYSFGRHASQSVFGHGGSQSSAAFADPEHDLVVALVCNGMPGQPRHNVRARDLHTAIYEDLGLS